MCSLFATNITEKRKTRVQVTFFESKQRLLKNKFFEDFSHAYFSIKFKKDKNKVVFCSKQKK